MPGFLRSLLLAQMLFSLSAANSALAAVDQGKCKNCNDQCAKTLQQCVNNACADNNGFFVRPGECKIKEIEYQDKYRAEVEACRKQADKCLEKCDADYCK